MLVCIYTSIKYLPLVYVSLVSNLGPLLTAVFSFFLLKKGLSKLDTAVLLVSFGGVCLLITEALEEPIEIVIKTPELPPAENISSSGSMIIPIITLLLVPILSASQAMVLRSLRELSEYTIGSYMSFSMILIYGPLVYLTENSGFGFLYNFGIIDWLVLIGLGFTSSCV